MPLVYEELRLLAAQKLLREAPGQTLQPTALVHEAYLRLVGERNQNWTSHAHFFRAAAEAMRRILIDRAGRRDSQKHSGHRQRVDLEAAVIRSPDGGPSTDLIALDEALTKLAAEDYVKAEVVKPRYFAGLTAEQTAEILGISAAWAWIPS